jgi:DNA helicase-2/ATP-dependent DNA helicase PcrA
MTIHSAKGLEFKYVYVVGLEENLFPSQLSLNSRQELEEERRLFYVALTRAMKRLTLSFATSRFKFGSIINAEPSRFLQEIDPQFLSFESLFNSKGTFKENKISDSPGRSLSGLPKKVLNPVKTSFGKTSAATPPPDPNFVGDDTSNLQTGMNVEHQRFGKGIVLSVEGAGDNKKANIDFEGNGKKMLVLKFAKLKIVT